MAFYPQIKTWKDMLLSFLKETQRMFLLLVPWNAMEFFVVKFWFKKWLDFDPGSTQLAEFAEVVRLLQ